MPQMDLTTYMPLLFWILLLLAVFFKVLISESTLNFLNLPKLQGKVAVGLNYYIYRSLTNIQTKYLIFWSCDPLEQFDMMLFPTFLTNPSIFIIFILLFLYFNFKVNDTFILHNKNIWFLLLLGDTSSMLKDNLHVTKNYAFFYMCALFLIILVCNCVGMIPYTFTVTSSLMVTFFLAAMFFGGVTLIGVFTHGWKALEMFIPAGVPTAMMPFLVLIEMISYFSSVISLSVRLFANMMSGHTLLKMLLAFFWMFFNNLTNILPLLETFMEVLPWLIIIMVTLLECAIAYLQAYVFTVLMAIYLNDCINLH